MCEKFWTLASQSFRDVLDPGAFDHFEDLRLKVGIFSPAPRQPCLQLAFIVARARPRKNLYVIAAIAVHRPDPYKTRG